MINYQRHNFKTKIKDSLFYWSKELIKTNFIKKCQKVNQNKFKVSINNSQIYVKIIKNNSMKKIL